ncbi:MAG: ABC transporter ATP-binding protein [Prochloraceae cyanobacterium]|nr:ABC transporter ATP-binding protein [Prochloraceae cyanobacterium]
MAKLQLNSLQKKYTPKAIPVKDITIEVEDGEFLTLLGPSGCGKSTLLRLIAGLEPPTKGQISIGGKNVNGVAPGDRNIAMVFQSYALYPHMSVAENIGTALKLRKISKSEIEARVGQVADKLGLGSLLDRKPSKLSGGQRQRVALARALVRNPEVFLLDEPLSNLDALLREQVRAELKQLFKQQNKPVVYVTHDQTEAMTLSSKVAVLYDGLVQQLDPPSRIYTHPANEFVAGFVGSPQMNLLVLKCEEKQAILGDFKISLPKLPTVPPHIVLGIRPEDIRLVELDNSDAISGQIYLIEELGKENLVSIQVEGSQLLQRKQDKKREKFEIFALENTKIVVRVLISDDNKSLQEGDAVKFIIPPEKMHWFDVKEGYRLN